MVKSSRHIPEAIKREVRKRCGFGCVICGLPLYEYDHMNQWASVKEHVAKDITLLCNQHHREVTDNLLPREDVKVANKSPYNIKNKRNQPYLFHFSGDNTTVDVGGNIFTGSFKNNIGQIIPIIVDHIPLISFTKEEENLFLNMNIFDEKNKLILQILNNELLYDVDIWDITFIKNRLTIREKLRKVLVNIKFETPNKITIDNARLLCNGVEVMVKKDYVLVTNNMTKIVGNSAINTFGGILLGDNLYNISCAFHISGLPRNL